MVEVNLPNGASVDVPGRVNGFVFEEPADDPEAGLGQGPTVVARWVRDTDGSLVAVRGRGTNYRAFYWPEGRPNGRRTLHGPVGGIEVLRNTANTLADLGRRMDDQEVQERNERRRQRQRDDDQPSLTQSTTTVEADTGGTVDVVSRARPLTPMAQDKLQDYSPVAEITAGEIENPPLGVSDDTLVGYRLGEMPPDEFFSQHQLDTENNTLQTQDTMVDFQNDRMRDAHYWAAQARGFMEQQSSASVQDRFRVAIQAGTPFVVLRDFGVPDGEAIANEMMDYDFPQVAVSEFGDYGDDVKLSITPTDDRLKSRFVDDWETFESNREFTDDASRGVEETPGGTAAMQEAGMSDRTLEREVRVEGQPGDRRYNFDDGTDSRKAYIPPSAFMDAVDAVEDELGDANQYVASGDAGTVVFTQGDGFERYEFNRPERDDRYPFDQQSGGVSTDLGSLEPETVDDDDDTDDRQQRTTQGTLGGDSPLDPGEFPTTPDAAAERQREQMRREEQQESLEGDAPEFDPAADRKARERRQARAERTQERIDEGQADLTGDRVNTEDVTPAETVDDDDEQQGLASFLNDDNGNGGGSGN